MVINISQSFFIKLCCGIFFLQAIVASALPGHSLQSLNAQSQQDVLVICTGSQTKWIAAERYFDFGEIIEVMPPSDIDETQLLFACPGAVANDHKPFSLAFANLSVPTPNYVIQLVWQLLDGLPLTQLAYALPSTRAPPILR